MEGVRDLWKDIERLGKREENERVHKGRLVRVEGENSRESTYREVRDLER